MVEGLSNSLTQQNIFQIAQKKRKLIERSVSTIYTPHVRGNMKYKYF